MPDQFDIQRKWDHAAGDDVDELMEKLEEDKETARTRHARLIPLDESHYFDPQDQWVILKDGSHFHKLNHSSSHTELTEDGMGAEATREGFVPVQGGVFWNPKTKSLYLKNDGHYVLYTHNRRKRERS